MLSAPTGDPWPINSYINDVTFLAIVSIPYIPHQYKLMNSFFNPSVVALYHSCWFFDAQIVSYLASENVFNLGIWPF